MFQTLEVGMYIFPAGGIMKIKCLEMAMKTVVTLFILLCAASSFAGAAFVDSDLNLIFPQKLAGLEYDQSVKYEAESFGYSIFYKRDESLKASVTVCNLGFSSIINGYKGKEINLMFEKVDAEHRIRIKDEEITGLKKRGSTVMPREGNPRFSNRAYQYFESCPSEADPVKRGQSVYITAVHNNLIKLDFVFDITEGKQARAVSEQMLAQLIGMLKARPGEEELLLAACDALLLDPSGYGGRTAAQQVLAKAQTMGDLVIYDKFFAWPSSYYRKPPNADLLIAAYFAGMLQVVVPQGLDAGGEPEGFAAMLKAYEVMRAKEEIKPIEKLDEWVPSFDKQALFDQLLIEFDYRLPGYN